MIPTWNEDDTVTPEVIEQYKAGWHKHGFPDVDYSPNSRVEVVGMNEPVHGIMPEARLLNCIIVRSFVDLERGRRRCSKKHRDAAKEAADWFASTSRELGSFEWVCDLLKYEPSYIRRKIAEPRAVRRLGKHPTQYVGRDQPISKAKLRQGGHRGGWYKESL